MHPKMKFFSLVTRLSKFPLITLHSSWVETKRLLLLMFNAENQCKTPRVVDAIDGTHVFIKAPVFKSWHDYYWLKQIFHQYTSCRGIRFAVN